MVKMTSEIGRILKCLTSKSYHSLQDDAYTHVHLIPQAEVSELNSDASDITDENQGELIVNHQQKNKIRRPRSAGDITETLHQCNPAVISPISGSGGGTVSTFPGGASGQGPEVHSVVSSSAFSRSIQSPTERRNVGGGGTGSESNNNNNNNNDTSSSNGGGGILSFFGVKFKSGTKHLDKHHHHQQQQQRQDCGVVVPVGKGVGGGSTAGSTGTNIANNNNNKSNATDLRYTKFPLSYGKNSSSTINSPSSNIPPLNIPGGQSGGGGGGGGSSSNNIRVNDVSPSSGSSSASSTALARSSNKTNKPCRSPDSSSQVDSSTSPCDASSSTSSGSNVSHPAAESTGLLLTSDSPFEESQIHCTPQTRTYAHPHKSPLPIPHGRAGGNNASCSQQQQQHASTSSSSSSGNFLTNTVSSIGRKVVNSVTPGSKNKNKSKLKVKSKSDNNLHRVNIDANNVNANSVLASVCGGNGGVGPAATAAGVPRNASATTFTSYLVDNESSSSSQRRLNSVQLGDHATIRLPWTGFQQINNLSSVSSTRTHIPNTHNNNFEFSSIPTASSGLSASSAANNVSSERYVECGSNILRTAAAPIPGVLSSNCGPRLVASSSSSNSLSCGGGFPISGSSSGQTFATRRRSRSLERCSNHRVNPHSQHVQQQQSHHRNHPPHSLTWREIEAAQQQQSSPSSYASRAAGSILSRSQSRKESGSEKEAQRTRSAHSLERNTSLRVRQLLTPTEREILLRNIDWNSGNRSAAASSPSSQPPQQYPEPPRRPDKPSKSSIIFQAATLADNSSSSASRRNHHHKENQLHQRRPPFEKLHRSAPNSSFSNSSESGESTYSAPPSPPPRPPSTLKPNSRLIIHHPSSLTASTLRQHQQHHHHLTQTGSLSPGSSGGSSSITMNPTPKRRPVAPRSHGSSSDSGVSHISSSTVRGTSDFSDESAGSVNISQHSSSQHSASVLSHSTTSSSGVSHQSSSATSNSSGGGAAAAAAAAAAPASSTTPIVATAPIGTAATTTTTTAPAGISLEDVRNSGFINKPLKGWLHSDQMLSKEGVTYTVRYIGCLDVNTSMKSLDFDTRSLIAKECINQVCEAAGLRSQDKKRKIDRRVIRILGMRPRLEHAGSDVRLTITSTCLKLTSLETGAVIAVHDMPNISFASGGDATMLDFVAYVAKDAIVGRACFVLECGSGLAQDVITTVGQAFELRFKEYLQKRPPPPRIPMDDPEYYNDLPGKVPPDIHAESKDKIQNVSGKSKNATSNRAKEPPPLNLHSTSDSKELSVNLIDFEAPTPPAFGPSVEDKQLDSFLLPGSDNTNGANNLGASGVHSNSVMGTGLGLPNSPSQPPPKDPFDMQPFAASLPQSIPVEVIIDQRRLLEGEIWFHGTVSREKAEDLLKHDGDFLVRESKACPGQFVLTGLQGGSPKHLLLVDPEGVVRTKDRTFDNVIHLIKYHSDNCLPIISAESMVLLRTPVPRTTPSS